MSGPRADIVIFLKAKKPTALAAKSSPTPITTSKSKATKKSADVSEELWKCEVCKNELHDDESSMLECEVCEHHYCNDCLKLSEEEYEFLSKRADLHWFCANCEGSTLLSIKNDKDIAQKCAEYFSVLESKLLKVEADVTRKADIQELVKLEMVVDGKAEKAELEQLQERVLAVETSLNNPSITNVQGGGGAALEPKAVVNNSLDELKDREARKDNIVIFNIAECSEEEIDVRKDFDAAQATELFRSDLGVAADVSNPVRLGKRQVNAAYPRPLRVTVNNERTKWNILKAAKNLRESGKEELKVVYIKRDMTRMERMEDENLRKQLMEKRKEAEEKGLRCTWIIRRGRLVNQQRTEQTTS